MAIIPPNIIIIRIKPIIDNIKPVMAIPLGALNNPINENKNPRNHITKLTTGAQETISPKIANMNPAVPIPLDLSVSTTIVSRTRPERIFCIVSWGTEWLVMLNCLPHFEQKMEFGIISPPQKRQYFASELTAFMPAAVCLCSFLSSIVSNNNS